jgi:RHH-type transcriptional regulator, rel operon repressor / antitoxin RelB
MASRLSLMLLLRMILSMLSRGTEMAANTAVLTVRIPVALQQQLDTVAQAMERSRAWVITQALEHFVAGQASQVEEIHKALAEADAGDFATTEEMAALNTKYKP